eukprot:gb/GECG01003186.1/.p1 GENE.gb/GECG01003186.1/~~gb/GECG01003186.1/.p1  ORF type:complete len:953 (+),score=133.80 gb/GECG01003186.1/:1-2859(+)
MAQNLYVGATVLIQGRHRGVIKFLGTTEFDPQKRVWAGVELDRPIGKHNGTVRGKTYFKSKEKHGTFVQPLQCELHSPEKEAAGKIQAVARQRIAQKEFRRELDSATFNELDNNDENLHIRRRNRLIAAGLASVSSDTPSAKARQLASEEIDAIEVEKSYSGVHLKFPLTEDQVLKMIKSFKEGKILHYKYVMQILLAARERNAVKNTVVETSIKDNERLTICGDTHGQLQDLFSVFTINGTPDNHNRYLFNGDFVDRGPCGAEIVLTLLAFQLVYPQGCMLNRGNHEERSQNETGGFMSEVLDKYNGATQGDPNRGVLVYDAFETLFDMLPLATSIKKRQRKVFVVHGGLFDRTGIKIEHINAINRKREIPWGRHTFEDRVFEDLLWSDPKNRQGTAASSRGAGVFFGQDITDEFCSTNGVSLLVRSHEMVQEGFQYMHGNKLLTIFSASKYCNRGTNRGAYIVFEPDLNSAIEQFMAGRIEATDPKPLRDRKAGALLAPPDDVDESSQSDANRRMLIERICLNKHDLFWFWSNSDKERTGKITKLQWAEGMRTVLAPLDLPWLSLAKELVEFEEDGMISYPKFLNRYHIEMRPEDTEWQDAVIERVCEKLYSCCASLEEAYWLFDVNKDGRIEYSEFVDALDKLDVGLSRKQIYELMNSIDKDKDAHIDFKEFTERFQVVFTKTKHRRDSVSGKVEGAREKARAKIASLDKWTTDTLNRVGRALFKEGKIAPQVFSDIDTDADGVLSENEFYKALKKLSFDPPLSREEVKRLVTAMDANESGSVNYLEFISAFKVEDRAQKEHGEKAEWQRALIEQIVNTLYEYRIELAAAFEKFDLNHNGVVSSEEFRIGLQALTGAIGSPITDVQADELMRILDKNRDGNLSYEEFLSGFRLVDEHQEEESKGEEKGIGRGSSSPRMNRPSSFSSLTRSRSVEPNVPIGVVAARRQNS